MPKVFINASQLMTVVSSFANGSAHGLDGLRPQHLKDLLSFAVGDAANFLKHELINLVNHFSGKKSSPKARELFFGASLFVPLRKKKVELVPSQLAAHSFASQQSFFGRGWQKA